MLTKANEEAADTTVGWGRALLQRIFGVTLEGEEVPETVAELAVDPAIRPDHYRDHSTIYAPRLSRETCFPPGRSMSGHTSRYAAWRHRGPGSLSATKRPQGMLSGEGAPVVVHQMLYGMGGVGTSVGQCCSLVVHRTALELPKSSRGDLTLYMILKELQALLVTWAGRCPTCHQQPP
ncbi:hypothetical protein [Streptosporangium sp. NPDC050280]|uniref:hypothetical protein n=1 Tax=unclassified Streptosporangium TaxID=2632669 RepID=UPI003444F54F